MGISMKSEIEGRTALVTGANRGIGKAIVDSLINHGAKKVYAAVRSLEKADSLVKKHGEKVSPVLIDLNKPESIKAAAKAATDVDLVINNAGILNVCDPLSESTIETFKEELEVNVYGLVRMAQSFAPILENNGEGIFVQLNSVASLRSFADFSTYCASKAAAYSFTQALKDKFQEKGIAVISVHPGPIETDMAKSIGMEGEPVSIVSEDIIAAINCNRQHVFPDSMAKDFWSTYQPFAEAVVEG